MKLKEEIGEIGRLSHIISVLFEEGLDYLVYELEIHTFLPFYQKIARHLKKKAKKNFEKSVLNSLQRLGGIFVKGGQILSTRPDIIPGDFAGILEKLQDEDIPFEFRNVKKIIESELKQPLDEVFIYFEKEPISAASLGQVHKAVLCNGDSVAIKVQRPGIEKDVKEDLKILKWLLKRIEKKKPELKKYNLGEAYEELKRYTMKELDYNFEAENIGKFEKFFKNDADVIIPHVYKDYTTKRVLVMRWEDGDKLKPYYGTSDGKIIQKIGTEAMVRQYFELGTFQGDPHPGNFLVSRDLKVVFLDLGMIGFFDKQMKKGALEMFLDLLNGDAESVTEDIIRINTRKRKGKKIDKVRLLSSNKALIEEWHGRKVKEYSISRLLYKLILNAIDEGIKFPPSLVLFAKSIMTIEEVAVSLNPNFSLVKDVRPLMAKILRKEEGLKGILKIKIKDYERRIESNLIKFSKKAEKLAEEIIDEI